MLKNKTNTTRVEIKNFANQRRTNEEISYIEQKNIHSNIQHWDMKLANGTENDGKKI